HAFNVTGTREILGTGELVGPGNYVYEAASQGAIYLERCQRKASLPIRGSSGDHRKLSLRPGGNLDEQP
ncbi:MAG TPA: hypothetical protein VFQ68_08030, partial [Streptosporangiaceae bacterium]|nr:hypothetical protein [Streptosporangiaceae bacterium]